MVSEREPDQTTLTRPHFRLIELLADRGYQVEVEVPVGKYYLDCYIRELHLGFEADGPHHRGPRKEQRDAERDKWILDNAHIPILRIPSGPLMRAKSRRALKDTIDEFIDEHAWTADKRRRAGEMIFDG